MSTYYVNAATGINQTTGGYGTSPSKPWQTIQYGLTNMTGGSADSNNVLLVAPGTYREKVTFASSYCTIQADPLLTYGSIGVSPGMVRITGCNASEIPQTGSIISGNNKNSCTVRGHSADYPMVIDGFVGGYYAITGVSVSHPLAAINYVYGHGAGGGILYATLCTGCLMWTVTAAYTDANCNDCVGIAPYATSVFNVDTSATGPITLNNCTIIAGYNGVNTNNTTYLTTCNNCLVLMGYQGFVSSAAGGMTCNNCLTECNTGYKQTAGTFTTVNCFGTTGGTVSGSPGTSPQVTLDMGALVRALGTIRVGGALFGTGTGSNTDILGRTKNNPCDIGAFNSSAANFTGSLMPQIGRGRVVNK